MDKYDLLSASPNRINLYWSEEKQSHLGYVEVVDVMPRLVPAGRTGDVAIVQGARISYGSTELRSESADDALVSYLVEHYHTSPLELASVKFHINCPLYVFNQLIRHRTAKVNCTSRRYTKIVKDTFYVPAPRLQDAVNKQGSLDVDVPREAVAAYDDLYQDAANVYAKYEAAVDSGIAKEIARGAMPQNIMTEFVWKSDLHNFVKMLRLRIHQTAQKEIRDLAIAMSTLVQPMFPAVFAAVERFWTNSINFSADEIEIIRKGKDESGNYAEINNKRRKKEFDDKIRLMGL